MRYIKATNPVIKIRSQLLLHIEEAQRTYFPAAFQSADDLLITVINHLKLNLPKRPDLRATSAIQFSDMPYKELYVFFVKLLQQNSLPEQAIRHHAPNLASRTHLVRAFADPDAAIEAVKQKVTRIVASFPSKGEDIEVGRNKGDVLDPFILAATQYLLHQGNFEGAISSTVAHKALMIIEGLLGHLNEDVIGMMRGNVRVPEPRGDDQELFDYTNHPFPGADIVQPPYSEKDKLKFHQIKTKTGSAKGGDGRRLGEQLRFLSEHYDAGIYYHALVGNTLIGHRSKTGVEKAAPQVVVLVGDASFRVLTGSIIGPQLLLRLYQEAFLSVAHESGYSINTVTKIISEFFKKEASKHGEGFLETILSRATQGKPDDQDSRLFNRLRH